MSDLLSSWVVSRSLCRLVGMNVHACRGKRQEEACGVLCSLAVAA